MLERARSGEGAVLGDVADQEHRDVLAPREGAETGRRFPDLPDGAGRAVQPVHVDGLDRVDDEQAGRHGLRPRR